MNTVKSLMAGAVMVISLHGMSQKDVEVKADDLTTEKKDKSINEPLQFYTSKARQPYEIVVNKVGKDLIVGYLSTPKVTVAR